MAVKGTCDKCGTNGIRVVDRTERVTRGTKLVHMEGSYDPESGEHYPETWCMDCVNGNEEDE